jgi:hypothetical protein
MQQVLWQCFDRQRVGVSFLRGVCTDRTSVHRSSKHETPIKWLEEVMTDQTLRRSANLSFKSDIDFLAVCTFSLFGLALSLALLRLAAVDVDFLLFAG